MAACQRYSRRNWRSVVTVQVFGADEDATRAMEIHEGMTALPANPTTVPRLPARTVMALARAMT